MSCSLTFECDDCGEQVITDPLAGDHPEVRMVVRYPEGWGFDEDGERALCPACVSKQ